MRILNEDGEVTETIRRDALGLQVSTTFRVSKTLVYTQWFRPLPGWARTLIWLGEADSPRWRDFCQDYDTARVSEGGLLEAHAHFVAQVRRGEPLGWGDDLLRRQ